ncbi:MAG: hypothetical protein MHM6MM_004256 [Cercozoa sp. M6MM]
MGRGGKRASPEQCLCLRVLLREWHYMEGVSRTECKKRLRQRKLVHKWTCTSPTFLNRGLDLAKPLHNVKPSGRKAYQFCDEEAQALAIAIVTHRSLRATERALKSAGFENLTVWRIREFLIARGLSIHDSPCFSTTVV